MINPVDYTHDSCIRGNEQWLEGYRRFCRRHKDNCISNTRIYCIQRDDRIANIRSAKRHGLDKKQFFLVERFHLLCCPNSTDDLSEVHKRANLVGVSVHVKLIDDGNNNRIDGLVSG